MGKFLSNDGTGIFADSGQSLDYQVELSGELKYSPNELSLTAADINGDGSLDVVTGDFTAAKVWFNNVAPTLTVTNSTVLVEQDAVAGNSGLVLDSAYDSLTLASSIGTVTNNDDGTWSWSLTETSNPGTTTVTVTATDSSGSSTEVSFELVVGLAPVIAATNSSVTVTEGQAASNSGSFSDPDSALAPILTASVGTVNDNGNGTWSWSFDTSDGPDQSQTVTITATDAQGLTSTVSFTLVINNQAPVITAVDTTVTVNEGATAFMTGTISDAGQDVVTLSASIGTVNDNGDGTWNWLFDTNDGPDDSRTVTITATDSDGAASQVSFDLIVNNVGPALNFDASTLFLFEGQTASKSGTVSDVDGIASLTASQGTVVLNSNGTWTWTDIASTSIDTPPQRVVLTATDQDGAFTTREFTLTVYNTPVIFHFDASDMTVNEGEMATRTGTYENPRNEPLYFWSNVGQFTDHGDGTFTWNWLATDGPATQGVNYSFSDDDDGSSGFFQVAVNNVAPAVAVNNASVTIEEGSTASNSGTISDVANDTVTLTTSTGTVINNGDGTWSWTFNTNDGPDQSQTVIITATDSDGAATSTSFSLIVNNIAPTVSVANAAVSVSEGETATNTGSFGDAGLDVVELAATVGTVTSNGDGTWSWLFDTNDGPDQSQTVTITATDSDGAISTTSFVLTVNNVAPTVSAANATVSVDEGQTATNSGSFGDVGLDTVTLTASTGTVTNNGDGTWSWTFNTNDGPDQSQTVIITATDSDGAATSTSFSLIVNNIAPTVSVANAAVSVSEGETALNTGSFGDAGLDVVELTATIGTVTSNGDGTWSWSFDTNDGPDQSQIVTITATDSDGAISTTTFTLTIKNVAPMSSLIGFYNGNWWISTADERGVYAIHVAASGPASTIKKVLTGDFNGDGLDDLAAWVTNGDWLVGLSDGKGLFTFSTWTSWTVSGIKEVHVGDFNNDGKDDIIGLFPIPGGNRGRWWVGQSNGTQFQNRNWGDFGNFTGILDVAVGNFDGMKGDDLAIITVTGNIFMAKTSNTRFQYMFSHNWNVNYGFNYFQTGDFNGDGRDDVVAVFGNEANRSIFVAKSTGPGTGFASMKYAGLTALHTFDSLLVGDFNGDGKDDVAARLNTTKWWLGLAGVNEFNFTFGTTWSFATNGVNDIHVGSTNGDGNSDILGRDNNGNWYSAESNSTSLTNRLVDMWAPVNWQFVNGGNFQPQTTSEMAVFPSAPLKLEAEEASTPELTDRWSGATESTSIAGPATTESATPLKPADKEEERIEDYASFGEGSLLDLLYS